MSVFICRRGQPPTPVKTVLRKRNDVQNYVDKLNILESRLHALDSKKSKQRYEVLEIEMLKNDVAELNAIIDKKLEAGA